MWTETVLGNPDIWSPYLAPVLPTCSGPGTLITLPLPLLSFSSFLSTDSYNILGTHLWFYFKASFTGIFIASSSASQIFSPIIAHTNSPHFLPILDSSGTWLTSDPRPQRRPTMVFFFFNLIFSLFPSCLFLSSQHPTSLYLSSPSKYTNNGESKALSWPFILSPHYFRCLY